MNALQLFKVLAEIRGGRHYLVTPVSERGSLPCPAGVRMLVEVLDDKVHITGTVGGGKTELAAIETCKFLSRSEPQTVLQAYSLDNPTDSFAPVCGGHIALLFEPVVPCNVYEWTVSHLLQGHHCVESVRIHVPNKLADSSHEVVSVSTVYHVYDGETLIETRTIGPALPDALAEELAASGNSIYRGTYLRTFAVQDGSELVDTNTARGHEMLLVRLPLLVQPYCIIFGGGHVGAAVSEIASLANFYVIVVDDRQEFSRPERFPGAHQTIHASKGYTNMVKDLPLSQSYCVVVTHGHIADLDVVTELLRFDPAYIGMIGSRRKKDTVFGILRTRGFTDRDLERIINPVGLPIGGDTPGEIAVGIVGEMIALRYKDTPKKK